jgi:outer membrane protein, heavy metal efflux system
MRFNNLSDARLLRGDTFALRACRACCPAFVLAKRVAGVGSVRRPISPALLPGKGIARPSFFNSDARNSPHLQAGLRLADLRFPFPRPSCAPSRSAFAPLGDDPRFESNSVMKNNHLNSAILLCLIVVSATRASAVPPVSEMPVNPTNSTPSLEGLVGEVLANNSALRSARLKWEAMQERPDIVRALPDPMVTYGYWFQSVETRVGPMNQRVGVAQKIPFFGKRSLASDKASQEALVTMWEYQTLTRELILRTKSAYYDLYRIDRSRDVLTAELDLLKPIIETAQARYEAGKAHQQDVLKARLASTSTQNRLLALNQQRESALARLNALRERPQDSHVVVGEMIETGGLPDRQVAFSIAERYRQELQAANVMIERDEISLALAKKERWPDFTFGVDYTQINNNIYSSPPDNGQDAVMGFVSINIPLWFGKLRAQQREAEKRLESSREARVHAEKNVSSEVQDAWFRAQVALDQVTLYNESLLPESQQTFDASQAGYEAGTVTFIDLLDSERALLNFRLGLIMSEAELAKALAALERAMGVDLNVVQEQSAQGK